MLVYEGNTMKNKNIILIGMPAAGKSTVGRILAEKMNFQSVDADRLIEKAKGKTLEAIIDEVGPEGFNKVEEEVNASIDLEKHVIATGGSVIYGPKAMEHFDKTGIVVYLEVEFDDLANRVGDIKKRGISIKEGMTFRDLYDERIPLYEKYAHIKVNTTGETVADTVDKVYEEIQNFIEGKED